MRPFTTDPRIRHTLNQISDNLESANERTRYSLYTVSERFIQPAIESLRPCLVSTQTCLEASCQPCFSARDQIRRQRPARYSAVRRGREGANFDFYDDWDQDEDEWAYDEMDALLAGSETEPPGRNPGMSYGYGARASARANALGDSTGSSGGPLIPNDPTVIPKSNIFGFLEGFAWRRGTKYRPNASNLQDNIGKRRGRTIDHLFAGNDALSSDLPPQRSRAGGNSRARGEIGRQRSNTSGSLDTTNSLSSRGDIFPSDEDIDDAQEIDEDMAAVLARKYSGLSRSTDDQSSLQHSDLIVNDSHRTSSSTSLPTQAVVGTPSLVVLDNRAAENEIHERQPPRTDPYKEETTSTQVEEARVDSEHLRAHNLVGSERDLSSHTRTLSPPPPLSPHLHSLSNRVPESSLSHMYLADLAPASASPPMPSPESPIFIKSANFSNDT